jgi:hypothetical protein
MIFMGIDPGLSGWMVCIGENGGIVDAQSMPVMAEGGKNVHNVPELLRRVLAIDPRPSYIAMERPGIMPGQGGLGNFTIGRTFGMWEAVCAILEIPHEFVHPSTWKKALSVPTPKAVIPTYLRDVKKLKKAEKKERDKIQREARKERKEAAVAVAVRMYPAFSFVPDGCRKPDDNLAEAALLAAYARQKATLIHR